MRAASKGGMIEGLHPRGGVCEGPHPGGMRGSIQGGV